VGSSGVFLGLWWLRSERGVYWFLKPAQTPILDLLRPLMIEGHADAGTFVVVLHRRND
jgi:hypothetical protein